MKICMICFVMLLAMGSIAKGFVAEESYGQIHGVVLDAVTGKGIPNANVEIVGTTRGAATDSEGKFSIRQLGVGKMQIKASVMGYGARVIEVNLAAGKVMQVSIALESSIFLMEQVVVTATRSDKIMQDVPVVTELISRSEIDEKGAEDLSDILEERPGITIESNSSGGKTLRMNGIDGKNILILVDGIPLAGKVSDRHELNLLDSDKIERVEIVKGPGSALYGSEAMGGVINIITKGFLNDLQVTATARTGSNDLYSGNLNLSGNYAGIGFVLTADHNREGFGKSVSEIDIKSHSVTGFGAKLGYSHENLGMLQLFAETKKNRLDTESKVLSRGRLTSYDNSLHVENWNGYLRWNRKVLDSLELQLQGYANENFRSFESVRQNSTVAGTIDTTKERILGLKSDLKYILSSHLKLNLGYDVSQTRYEAARIKDQESHRNQGGVFAQIEGHPHKKIQVLAGGRYDKITDLDGHFSPRISAMYTILNDLKLRASWGGGFRAPSFIELYSNFTMPIPGRPLKVVGNKDLNPERSLGGNIGVEYFWNNSALMSATFYMNKFTDLIVDYQKSSAEFSYLNVEQATYRGIEFQSKISLLQNLSTTLSYNYTEVNYGNQDGALAPVTPHSGFVRLNLSFFDKKFKLSLRDQIFSKRDILLFDLQKNQFIKQEKEAYHLADATLTYDLNRSLLLRIGGINLMDYRNENYGPFIGRSFFAGMDFKW